MPMIKICKESGCQNAGIVKGYCRLHYLKNWREIKSEEKRRAAERLNRYVEGICKKHPDRYIEAIRDGLKEGGGLGEEGDLFSERDELDSVLDDLGCSDDELERIISKIKIDYNH